MKSYTGKTIDEILGVVAKEKEVDVEELVYHITEEKAGFLGLGAQVTADVYHFYDVGEFIFDYLDTFFKNLGLEVEIEVQQQGEGFKVMLNAENNAIIIGKNGQTLQAINVVVRGATNATFKRRFHILVDINNYKEDRYEKIKSIAFRVAKTVQKTKVTATMDTMTNDERRVVHQYLNNMKFIRTESEGEGRNRRLKVVYDENKIDKNS